LVPFFLLTLGPFVAAHETGNKSVPDANTWGAAAEGLRLSLRMSQTKHALGKAIDVQVVVQNVDTREQQVLSAHPLFVFAFVVKGPDGKVVPLTKRGKEMMEAVEAGGKRSERSLKPKETLECGLELGEVYEFQAVGKYEIVASMQVPSRKDPKRWVTVTSNPLTITITAPKEKKDK
jgi:hypothetical protein